MGSWLNDALEAIDAKDISIVAHSQGCLVALEYASRFKKNLKSVSFVASGLATPVNAALIDAAENNPEAAIGMMLGWGFGTAGQLHQGPIPGNSMVARQSKFQSTTKRRTIDGRTYRRMQHFKSAHSGFRRAHTLEKRFDSLFSDRTQHIKVTTGEKR